jgi:phage terminase large subunit
MLDEVIMAKNVMSPEIDIHLPDKLLFLIQEQARYKVLYGGRGGLKSHTIARALIIKSLSKKEMILCTRNFQNSITDSVHKLLVRIIEQYNLTKYFHITKTAITSCTGSEFIFKGLERSINEIKSLEGVTICWIEEAAKVTKASWEILIPTIRQEGSEIWLSFNPDENKDFTYQKFVVEPRPNSIVVRTYYYDFDCVPQTMIDDAEFDKVNDPDRYDHVWLGNCKKRNDAQILKGKWEESIFPTPELHEIYGNKFLYGGDFGYSPDPATLVRMFIKEDGKFKDLYIEYEAYGIGVEVNELSALYSKVPESRKWLIKADSSRNDLISYLGQPYDYQKDEKGFNIIGAKKGPGSIEAGIAALRCYRRIYIHSRCTHAIEEAQYYCRKVDKITGEILPVIIDKHNHIWDAVRYGIEDEIMEYEEPEYDEADNTNTLNKEMVW